MNIFKLLRKNLVLLEKNIKTLRTEYSAVSESATRYFSNIWSIWSIVWVTLYLSRQLLAEGTAFVTVEEHELADTSFLLYRSLLDLIFLSFFLSFFIQLSRKKRKRIRFCSLIDLDRQALPDSNAIMPRERTRSPRLSSSRCQTRQSAR